MVMDRGICTLYNLKQTLHAGAYPVFSEGGGGGGQARIQDSEGGVSYRNLG